MIDKIDKIRWEKADSRRSGIRKKKVHDVRFLLTKGTYDLDKLLDIALDKLLDQITM